MAFAKLTNKKIVYEEVCFIRTTPSVVHRASSASDGTLSLLRQGQTGG